MNACRAAAVIALAGALCAPPADAQTLAASCGGLTTQSLASTTISAAQAVTAGSFTAARRDQPDRATCRRSAAWPA